MRRLLLVSIGFGIVCLASNAAFAGAIDAATALRDFNAVIYTNGSTTSDIEGAAVIGGNFSGATIYNNPTAAQPAGYGALTVFGGTSGNPINIDNGGSAYVGGNSGAIVNFNGGGGFYTSPPSSTIGDFESTFNSLSTSLSLLAATSTLPQPGNNEAINATPVNGIAVFDITAADLSQIPSFLINLNGASTVIFNVSGSSVNFNANDESGTNGANNIIWNFYQATNVALNTQIGGSVLATGATVTNQNQIDGALVANAWNGTGELHDWGFDGALPSSNAGGNSGGGTPAPEPASVALLGAGLVALAYARRRGLAFGR